MATETVIPENVRLAAKRGFVRTSAQALGATLTTGISATVILGVMSGEVELLPTLITLGVALLSPFIAGAGSYFSILSRGIPEDYRAEEEDVFKVETWVEKGEPQQVPTAGSDPEQINGLETLPQGKHGA